MNENDGIITAPTPDPSPTNREGSLLPSPCMGEGLGMEEQKKPSFCMEEGLGVGEQKKPFFCMEEGLGVGEQKKPSPFMGEGWVGVFT